MPVSILPAKPEDCAAIMKIATGAYEGDLLYQAGLPNPMTAEQQAEYDAWRLSYHLSNMRKPGRFFFKAVDDERVETLGYAVWDGPKPTHLPEHGQVIDSENLPMPDFISSDIFDEIGGTLAAASERATQSRHDVWHLLSIAVIPSYQGYGIGQRLVETGLDLVDKDGADCFLSSTPVAVKLYRKSGFAEIEKVSLLNGKYTITTMGRRSDSRVRAEAD